MEGDSPTILRAHSAAPATGAAAAEIAAQLAGPELACIILFAAPQHDLRAISARLRAAHPEATVIGCTTAGEIGPEGYTEDSVVGLGLTRANFVVEGILIEGLGELRPREIAHRILEARAATATREPGWDNEFAFLLVDGLSMREDELVSAIVPALGPTQLFGGSAGDNLAFRETLVLHDDRLRSDAAVLAFVRTRCDFRVFRYDNFVPTETCMVVTEADPANRIVKEINGEPAAIEYARLVGKDPNQLSPMTFAAHPVVVRMGSQHHVRAIQRLDPASNNLRFFSAIDEGLVLRVADSHDITEHLRSVLEELSAVRRPDTVIACDCTLRKLDAEQQQAVRAMSQLLAEHRVFGFSTYGEQYNGQHVNQTLTGVAIYPPEETGAAARGVIGDVHA